MRFLGLLGILLLLPINIFGFVHAWQTRDLKGAALMVFMAAMLAFFAWTLWRGARLERGSTHGPLAEGWAGMPVGAFFSGVVTRTVEGWIYLVGALLSAAFGVLALLWPEAVGIPLAKASAYAVLFGMWPIVSFAFYLKVCGPTYRTTIHGVILVLIAAGLPFYIAYR
jgi:hypothetical protein